MKSAAKKVLKDSVVFDARGENDTIRLWESYRDQATMWRSIALLQIPATCIALIFATIMWQLRTTILNVPAKPLPGIYAAQDIPDTEFIDAATEFLNLIASYQYNVARRQFDEASRMLHDTALEKFSKDIDSELQTIESTNRTQVFFVDPSTIEVDRPGAREVTVRMKGDRLKIVAGKELPLIKTAFNITMGIVPRNKLNPYGIKVVDYSFHIVEK